MCQFLCDFHLFATEPQIQGTLFPWLSEEIGEINEKQQQLISILELLRVEEYTLSSNALITDCYKDDIIGHLSRDSTAIKTREKPLKKVVEEKIKGKPGRLEKGEVVVKHTRRIVKQVSGMSLKEMQDDLPKACDVGTKKNSKGNSSHWIGYKLHIDAADGGIPISCLLASASMHDSQASIPLAVMSHK